jgi:integrase
MSNAPKGSKKPVRRPGRAITLDEVSKLMSVCGRGAAGLRNQAFIALGFGAGLRCAEILAVKPAHIERTAEGPLVLVLSGKGNKSRRVSLLPEFLAPIERWLERRTKLGITNRSPIICGITESSMANTLGGTRGTKGKPVSTALMRATLARLAKKAGIEGRVHCHGLRHGLATALNANRTGLQEITQQLGHSSTAITDRYLAKVSPDKLLAAAAAFPRFLHGRTGPH